MDNDGYEYIILIPNKIISFNPYTETDYIPVCVQLFNNICSLKYFNWRLCLGFA